MPVWAKGGHSPRRRGHCWGCPGAEGGCFQATWRGSCIPSSLSLTRCPCASSPAEQHPAKVQRSAGLVRKRLYALLSQGWWERGSEGKTNKHWLTPASTGVKVGWGIPFPSLLPGASRRCRGFELSFWTAAQQGPPALLVRRLTTSGKHLCLSVLTPV